MPKGQAMDAARNGGQGGGRGSGAEPGTPLGPVQDEPLPALTALGDRVLGVMMDGEHGFLDSRDDTVNDRQGKELAGALGDDEWGVVDTGGKQPGGHIGCTVTGPIRPRPRPR